MSAVNDTALLLERKWRPFTATLNRRPFRALYKQLVEINTSKENNT
jgi:hypothetical protein